MKSFWILPMLTLASLTSAQMLSPKAGAPAAATSAATLGIAAPNIPGAPFSADTVSESTRVLPNGEMVHVTTRGKLYRDSEGRTRRESETPKGGRSVMIADTVQRVMILVNPNDKSAKVFHWTAPTTGSQPPVPGASANLPISQPWASPPQSAIGASLPPGPNATLAPISASPVKVNSERLESRVLEGVTVTGMRVTRTTEAGAAGNEKAIVSTTETWMSPELKLTILWQTDDPRSGQSVTKIMNLLRTEPDASLFQVPSDYVVRDSAQK
jgi:hypothetical protein